MATTSPSYSRSQPNQWETDKPIGNWDRKTLQICQKKKTGHPVVLGTTIVEQETLKQIEGNVNIHFNATTETISMICKLIGSVIHLCILFAVIEVHGRLAGKDPHRSTGEQLHARKINTSRGSLLPFS